MILTIISTRAFRWPSNVPIESYGKSIVYISLTYLFAVFMLYNYIEVVGSSFLILYFKWFTFGESQLIQLRSDVLRPNFE